MKRFCLIVLLLICAPSLVALAQWDVMSATRRTLVGASGPSPPKPTGFTPASVSAADSTGPNTPIVTLTVTMSNGSTFSGTCYDTDPSGLTVISSAAGGCTLSSNSSGWSSANDGTYQLTLNMCEAGACLNPSGTNFTLTVAASSGGLFPTTAVSFDDEAAGPMVTALWAGNPATGSATVFNGNGCSATGYSAFACQVYRYQNDTDSSFPYIYTTRALTSGDLGSHTISVTAGTYSGSVTVTVQPPLPSGPPSYVSQTAFGNYSQGPYDLNNFYTLNQGYCSPCACFPSSGQKTIISMPLVDVTNASGCNAQSYTAAAAGSYTSMWMATIASAVSQATILGLRINSEWQGGADPSTTCSNTEDSPYANNPGCSGDGSGPVAPTTYNQAVLNFVTAMKTNYPNIKMNYQAPCDNSSDYQYWPASLASHLQLSGTDWYFDPQYDGLSETTEWTTSTTPQPYPSSITSNNHSGCPLANLVGWSAGHGLSVGTDEFCDQYGGVVDGLGQTTGTGYNLARSVYWLGAQYWQNFAYWDVDNDGNPGCQFSADGGSNAATSAIFYNYYSTSNYTYAGSFY